MEEIDTILEKLSMIEDYESSFVIEEEGWLNDKENKDKEASRKRIIDVKKQLEETKNAIKWIHKNYKIHINM